MADVIEILTKIDNPQDLDTPPEYFIIYYSRRGNIFFLGSRNETWEGWVATYVNDLGDPDRILLYECSELQSQRVHNDHYTYEVDGDDKLILTLIDDTLDRVVNIDRTHEIEESLIRSLVEERHIVSGFINDVSRFCERTLEAFRGLNLSNPLLNNLQTEANSLVPFRLAESGLEVERSYFRHCLMIAFVRGLGPGNYHENFGPDYVEGSDLRGKHRHKIYEPAEECADFILSHYYFYKADHVNPNQIDPLITIKWIDPGRYYDPTNDPDSIDGESVWHVRKRARDAACKALHDWVGSIERVHSSSSQSDVGFTGLLEDIHFTAGKLNENGKNTLLAAIKAADPSRINLPPTVKYAAYNVLLSEAFPYSLLDISNVFSDPGDTLAFTYTLTPETGVVTVTKTENIITITRIGVGRASLTLIATDSSGATATDEIVIYCR